MDSYSTACLKQFEDVSAKLAATANGLVMTHATWFKLKKTVSDEGPHNHYDHFHGMPVWVYGTVKDCMDRMMDQSKGERLQLVLDEDIPTDCLFHPWIRQQIERASENMGFSVRGYE